MLCCFGKIAYERQLNQETSAIKKAILIQVVRDIYKRAGGQCENCASTHALEVDHVKPRKKGGGNEFHNLRVLCRSCNQRAAIKEFGQQKMDRHINKTVN